MSTGKFILGTLAGLAIGAIAGILFAPEKGSTTRRQIKDKSDGYVDGLKSKFDDFSETLTEKFNHTKKNAEGFVDRGKSQFYNSKKHVKNTMSDFSHDVADDINHATS